MATRSTSSTTDGFRLRRRPRQVVLIAHVLSSVGWFGAATFVVFCVLAGAWVGDPALGHSLHQVAETAPVLTIVLGVASVVTGTILGLGTRFGLIRYWWVVIKIAISVAVIVTDAVLVPRVAHTAVTSGAAPVPLFGSTVAHVVLLAVATVLSFVKPKATTPIGARRIAAETTGRRSAATATTPTRPATAPTRPAPTSAPAPVG